MAYKVFKRLYDFKASNYRTNEQNTLHPIYFRMQRIDVNSHFVDDSADLGIGTNCNYLIAKRVFVSYFNVKIPVHPILQQNRKMQQLLQNRFECLISM